MSRIADEIKSALSMQEVAEFYGFHPNHSGYICCPFHREKTASLKIYTGESGGWHCFGCNKGGSAPSAPAENGGYMPPPVGNSSVPNEGFGQDAFEGFSSEADLPF